MKSVVEVSVWSRVVLTPLWVVWLLPHFFFFLSPPFNSGVVRQPVHALRRPRDHAGEEADGPGEDRARRGPETPRPSQGACVVGAVGVGDDCF